MSDTAFLAVICCVFFLGGFVKGVKPADLAGWDSPILPRPVK